MPEIGEIKHGQTIGKSIWKAHIWQACLDCGKERWVLLEKGKPANLRCRNCARQRQVGAESSHWKGGRIINHYGYAYVRISPNDFFYPMANKSGYVMEHRLMMARHMKRCLLSWEVVHHRNAIRDDNRLENLELLPASGKHNTIMEKELKRQTKLIKELQARVTLLEAELEIVKHNDPIIAVSAR